MKIFLLGLGESLAKVSAYLVSFGAVGLFAICLLDSTFVPLPSSADVLLIALSAANPHWMPIYVALAIVGSTIGCVILYYISRRAGSRALNKFSASKQRRVKELLDKYDVGAVLVACLLPPPFPLKLFVITTGVLRISVIRFALAIAVGRAFRYLLLGYLAARYGEHARDLLAKYYPWFGLGLAVLIVGFVVARGLLRRRPETVETLETGN